jgi:hypothetical protein
VRFVLALFACPKRFLRTPDSEAQFPCRAVKRPNSVLAWQSSQLALLIDSRSILCGPQWRSLALVRTYATP